MGRQRYRAPGQPVPASEKQDARPDFGEQVPIDSRGVEPAAHRRTGAGHRGKVTPLPHLVPQVDRDGNDLAGIRVPELAVPLATTTGWNFRAPTVGNPDDIYQLLGSYIPFATTRAARKVAGDQRLSIEERYRGVDDYVQRIRAVAIELIRQRYLLEEDLDDVLAHARMHWSFATHQR